MASDLDVVVIGAGISGIDAAYHLKTYCPNKSFAVLEKRETLGGTWQLFQYPGLRSDSDMFTFGYSWKPWGKNKAIAVAADINKYLEEAVCEQNLRQYMRFGDGVTTAAWCSEQERWTLHTEHGKQLTCKVLFGCTGYYHYDGGYTPDFKGINRFKGEIVHPQQWGDLDCTGKRVVVIGSGATAITLLPAICEQVAHVTMLQRSPTYIVSDPEIDIVAGLLSSWCPRAVTHLMARGYNILYSVISYWIAQHFPSLAKKILIADMRKELPDMPQQEFKESFTPRYNPWEQRVCLSPGGDFFKALRGGKASVVTATIREFTETGILLEDTDHELVADVVVTATGLRLPEACDAGCWGTSGIEVSVDGVKADLAACTMFQGVMMSGLPNFGFVFGYTNASWTLKADLACAYLCRLLNHMDRNQYSTVTPIKEASEAEAGMIDFSSSYFQRAAQFMPKQGQNHPWKLHQNYLRDYFILAWRSMDNEALKYTTARQVKAKL